MKNKNRIKRGFIMSLFIMVLSLGNYSRLTGTESIRPIHIVTLLACGMGIGIFVFTGVVMLRDEGKEENNS